MAQRYFTAKTQLIKQENETTIKFQYKYKLQQHTYTPIRDHITLASRIKRHDHTVTVAGCNRETFSIDAFY